MNSLSKIFIAGFLLFFTCIHLQAQSVDEFAELEQRMQRLENDIRRQNRIRISGYVQTQFQWGEKDAVLGVGAPNENPENSFSRFGIRRGRLGFVFQDGIVSANFQMDLTDRAINLRNAFVQLNDPIWGTNSLRTGLFPRPFGYKIVHSSAVREAPERAAVLLELFPGERDLGTMFSLKAPANSPWSILQLDAGLFAGNGRNMQTDSRLDFIGRIFVEKNMDRIMLGGGVSYYNGSVFQGTENVYTMNGKSFELNQNINNIGKFAKREYFGADLQFNFSTGLGLTKITSEYIFGQQPAAINSSRSPNASTRPIRDTYIRPVSGGYLMLVQELGKLPLSAVLKYDWYDPNTAVSGNDVGLSGTNTSETDLLRTAYGFGLLWNVVRNVRMSAYYELVKMEANSIEDYDFKGDLFTLRLQYRF